MSGFVPGGTTRYSCPVEDCRWFHDVQPGRYGGAPISSPGSLDDAVRALGRTVVRQVEQAFTEHFDQDHPKMSLEDLLAIAKTAPLELPAAEEPHMNEPTFGTAVIRLNGEPAPTASLTLLDSGGRVEIAVGLPATLNHAAIKRLRDEYANVRVEAEIGPRRYSGTCSLASAVGDYHSARVELHGQVTEQTGRITG